MAAAALSGTAGSVSLPTGNHGRIRAWTADVSQNVNDTTGFTQARFATCLGGIVSCRGQASGYLEYNAADTAPGTATGTAGSSVPGLSVTSAAMTLTAFTGCTLGFNAIISNIRLGQSVDGVGTVMFDFVSDGEIVETWDETP